jgi:hypothetical protein
MAIASPNGRDIQNIAQREPTSHSKTNERREPSKDQEKQPVKTMKMSDLMALGDNPPADLKTITHDLCETLRGNVVDDDAMRGITIAMQVAYRLGERASSTSSKPLN